MDFSSFLRLGDSNAELTIIRGSPAVPSGGKCNMQAYKKYWTEIWSPLTKVSTITTYRPTYFNFHATPSRNK